MAETDSAIKEERYVEALQILLQTEAHPLFLGADAKAKAEIERRLAFCYDYFEYRELAVKHYSASAKYYQISGDSLQMAYSLTYLADILEDLQQIEEAFTILERARKIFATHKDSKGLVLYYNNLGSVYENFKNYDTCIFLLQNALKLCADLSDSLLICITLNNLGDVKRKQGKHDQAIETYLQSLEISKKIGNKEEERGNLKDISGSYAALKMYEQAYLSHKRFYDLHQYLKIEKKIEQMVQIHLENTIQKANLEKESIWWRLTTIVLGLTFVLIGVITIFFIFRYKAKKDKELSTMTQNMLQLEIESIKYREEKTISDLKAKEETLREFSKMLAKNSEMVSNLQNRLKEALDVKKETRRYEEISKLTRLSILTQDDWNEFKNRFEEVYTGFFSKLRDQYEDLSYGDHRLLALIKLKLSKEEIASMIGVSPDSVKKARTRLKKRLNLTEIDKIEDWLEKF